jgi:CheY-like chemotaxis protein
LIVDENVDAACTLGMLCEQQGHDCELAYEGITALQAARRARPDVIFLDLEMPGMDGFEVARQLRQDPAFRDVLIIAVTGFGEEEDRRRSREAGIDYHVVKPADLCSSKACCAACSEEPRREAQRQRPLARVDQRFRVIVDAAARVRGAQLRGIKLDRDGRGPDLRPFQHYERPLVDKNKVRLARLQAAVALDGIAHAKAVAGFPLPELRHCEFPL